MGDLYGTDLCFASTMKGIVTLILHQFNRETLMHYEKIIVSLRDIAVRKGTASKTSKVEKPKKGKGSFKRQMKKFDLDSL